MSRKTQRHWSPPAAQLLSESLKLSGPQRRILHPHECPRRVCEQHHTNRHYQSERRSVRCMKSASIRGCGVWNAAAWLGWETNWWAWTLPVTTPSKLHTDVFYILRVLACLLPSATYTVLLGQLNNAHVSHLYPSLSAHTYRLLDLFELKQAGPLKTTCQSLHSEGFKYRFLK